MLATVRLVLAIRTEQK